MLMKLRIKTNTIQLTFPHVDLNPDTISNPLNINFIAQIFDQVPSPNRIVSSINCSKLYSTLPFKLKSLNNPPIVVFPTIRAMPSTTIEKN